ncbi:MAG: flagellin lysine-N-methylase [Oscillospiraceae bacterium]|nr:flagellin lysine-N-methylase [Oscillospiraceae bacterium]
MYYREPRYFVDFYCIGGDCPDNCCHGWRIDWDSEEVEKVKNAPSISQEMKELVDRTFVPNVGDNKKYMIKYNDEGICPFLLNDGYCKIQRELGAEYLSRTCMVYPRRYIYADDILYRFCGMSCYEMMKKMLHDEKAMDLVNYPIKTTYTLQNVIGNTPELLSEHPELKYRGELLEFFYELIADKKRSVEDSIVLGALAAQKFSQYVEDKNYDLIPDAIKAFKKQFHDAGQLKKVMGIQPNYNIKLGVLAQAYNLSKTKTIPLSSLADNTGNLNADLYLQGEKRLIEAFKDRPFCFRNIALNLLFELRLPFQFTEFSILENYSIFVTAYALLKLISIATSEWANLNETEGKSSDGNVGINFKIKIDTDSFVHQSCAVISRDLCHAEANSKKLLKFLKDKKMLSPAYLALLVK